MSDTADSTSQERPKSSGRTYTDEEWERMRLPFHHFYMEKNLSLKESAKRMLETYGFDATLRQWERRIAPEKWGFTKYASREDRLAAISAAGKTLLEVSCRGRRKSTASDGRPSLNEDRNMRRFARREVSRDSRDTRQRAKSVGELSHQSDHDMSGTSTAPSPTPSDLYSLDTHEVVTAFPNIDHEPTGDMWMHSHSRGSTMTVPQIRIAQTESMHNIAVPEINIMGPDDGSHVRSEPMLNMSGQPQINVHYGHPPQPQIDTTSFPSFPDSSSDPYNIVQSPTHNYSNHVSPHEQTAFPSTLPWHTSFVPDPTPVPEMFEDMSFTQMMGLDSHVIEGGNIIANQPLNTFEQRDTPPTGHILESLAPDDDMMEIRDPTHDDVHALLQEHYDKTMQMIGMCIQSCHNVTNADVMMRNLQLLQTGVQAQNVESDRNLRSRLKDVASTQRRATQMISDLSTNRRRKIDQLQAQVVNLQEQISTSNLSNTNHFAFD